MKFLKGLLAVVTGLWNFIRRWFLHLFQGNSLKVKRKRYVYGQVGNLPGLNVQNNGTGNIPFEQEPTLDYLLTAAKVQLRVFKNQRLRSGDAGAGAHPTEAALGDMTTKAAPDRTQLRAQLEANTSEFATQDHTKMSWPQHLDEYNRLFHPDGIPLPTLTSGGGGRSQAIADFFSPRVGNEGHFDDEFFANLRTAGFNPMVVKGIDEAPPEFAPAGFDDARYRVAAGAGFGDDTLAAAAATSRFYVCDYSPLAELIATPPDLGGTYPNDAQKYLSTAKAWFVLPPTASASSPASLQPVAIQLADGGVLFSPNDPNDTDGVAWTQAKYVVDSADGNYHELISHLGQTHLVIEPVVVSIERNLRERHEIYRLLSAHLEGTIFINNAAAGALIAPGRQVDEVVASTIELDQRMAVKARGIDPSGLFKFNQRFVPVELAARKVMDPKLIYPYRDDALRIWNAIHSWVGDYVDCYYRTDAHVAGDVELQNWADELVAGDGGQLQEFGESTGQGDKRLKTKAYLVDALSLIIFTGSAQHAAVNFAEAQIMVYVPAVGGAVYTSPPTSIPSTVSTYSTDGTTPGLLTPDTVAKVQLDFLALLGGVYYTRLGKYPSGQFSKRVTNGPLQTFQNNLAGIQVDIDAANDDDQQRPLIYPYLAPNKIPQSINI